MDFGPSKRNFLSWHIGETAFFCIHSVAHYSFINMSTKERKKNMGSVTRYTLYDSDCHNVTPDQFVSVLKDYVLYELCSRQ